MNIRNFLSPEEQKKVKDAIASAEKNTSGEIRVHLETDCKVDVLDRAANLFATLGMHKTAERNGVLFYVAVKSRKFAILGDAGINNKVTENFWDHTKEIVLSEFAKGDYCSGLSKGIAEAGIILKEFFPYQQDDINELSDELSFGK